MRLSLLPLAAALVWTACSGAQEKQAPRKAGDVVVKTATMEVPGVGKVEYELGTLYVPENRAEPKSRLIGVGFARFKADPKTDSPPVFLLPGGPGSSYLRGLTPTRVKDLLRFRAAGDVVLVDQRGYSEHGDVLMYRHRSPEEPLDQPASLERSTKAFAEMARAAVKEFEEKKIDLRGYTVKECADDVDDLRRALGYDKITLTGGSFGSQWSFAFMRMHPDRVVRALLAGVEPLDMGYDMPSHVFAAVQRIWWEAEQDERFKPYLPPGGIAEAAREVVRRLEREPVKVPLKGVTDSKTGAAVTVTLGPEDFRRAPQLRSLDSPAFVLSLYHGRYDQLALATNFARRSRTFEFPMIAALIDTSLGVTPKRRYLLENDPATAFLGRWNFDSYLATADIWPTADMGDEFRTEVVSQIPIVFVQGDWDLQTPVENVLQVAPYYRKGHVILVERGGHGVMSQLGQHRPELVEALVAFLKDGGTAKLPARVAVPAPKFAVPDFPPPKR
jgi:pimeloyl-ACP methyl ester carboxylesterase